MRKIDLTGYDVTVRNGETQEQRPYRVVDSLCTVLLHPGRGLNGVGLMDAMELARKIRGAGEVVLLEKDEYDQLKSAFDTMRGFGENDYELVRRVYKAPEVDVQEKQSRKRPLPKSDGGEAPHDVN